MITEDITGEREYYFNENIYPYYLAKGRELEHLRYLPKKISQIYLETIASFKAKSFILSAAGFRAIIEAICNHLKIKKTVLSEKIDLLYEKGILTEKESKRLHAIRFIGNDALHEIETPSAAHLLVALEIVNHILENLFIQDKKIKDRLDSIIDDYDEFLQKVRNNITRDSVGKVLSLSDILGKGIRLVKDKKSLRELEEKFRSDIHSKNIDFVSIDTDGKEENYKIEKVPNLIFGF